MENSAQRFSPKWRAIRSVFGTVVVFGVVLGLSACQPREPMAATLQDGHVVFVVCESVDVDSIRVELYPEEASTSPTVMWVTKGETQNWGDGHEFSYSESPPAWQTVVGPEDLDLTATSLLLAINAPEDGVEDNPDARVLHIDPKDLREGSWLQKDASQTEKPCP